MEADGRERRVTEVALALDRLSAGYDRAAVVRDLSLKVAPGEVVALIGPNGAGKTTTLRTISGVVKPMAGVVRLNDRDLGGVSPTARARTWARAGPRQVEGGQCGASRSHGPSASARVPDRRVGRDSAVPGERSAGQ
jgi:energy-coupling factor transporter ATP-binding protein EcfA2